MTTELIFEPLSDTEREHNAAIMRDWQAWGAKSRITSFTVINGKGELVAAINFKHTTGNGAVHCIAQRFENFRRHWFKSMRRGYGYDRHTACLEGFHAGGVMLKDNDQHWQHQFNAAGFQVHQIL